METKPQQATLDPATMQALLEELIATNARMLVAGDNWHYVQALSRLAQQARAVLGRKEDR